jgi:hypothetical protein
MEGEAPPIEEAVEESAGLRMRRQAQLGRGQRQVSVRFTHRYGRLRQFSRRILVLFCAGFSVYLPGMSR